MQQNQIVTSPRFFPSDLSSLFFMANLDEKEVVKLRKELYHSKFSCDQQQCRTRGNIQYCVLSHPGSPSYRNCPHYPLKSQI